uniref:ULP_PROTEASE domain-containing protein n=1 Tax=Strongyloides papillosus TaxID=174720 RepID=A0A0N5BR00_STREA
MLSHYHCEDRTSNGLESFHRKLNSRSVVGKHRKYEFFVEALKLLHFEEVIDFERHYSRELNEFTFLPTRRRYLERNRKIKALTNSFDVDGDNLLMVQKCAKLLAPRNVQQIFKSSGKIYTVEFDDSSDDSSDDLSNSDNFFDDTIIDVHLNAAFYMKEEVPKTRKRSCSSSSEKIVIKKRIDRNICNNVDKTVYPHDFLTSTKYYLDDQQVENDICLICGLKNISNFSIPLAAVSLEILKENPSISDSLVRGMFNPGKGNLFIMPLVYNNHWILFIVDTKKHEIYFYDSFDLYSNLISIFQKNFSNVIGIDINNYMITMIQGLKQDKNDFTNCGCYVVIEFYKFILHKETPKQLTPTQLWNLRVSWNDLLTELEKLS